MIQIQQVPPHAVQGMWKAFVRAECERLLNRFSDDWIPDDIYSDLVHTPPKATLFLLVEGKPVGFFIVELATAPRSLRKFLNVWILCGRGQMKYRDQVREYLRGLAKSCGCTKVEFRTARKGWLRALGDCKVKTYVIEMDVK